MYEQHRQAITRLTEHFSTDSRYLALIIAGSIANGRAHAESDIDVFLVATDEEFERCRQERCFQYLSQEFTPYPNGYVDGKIINEQFVRDAAQHGSEPTRFAFTGSWASFSHIPGFQTVIDQIPVYPLHEQAEKMQAFYCQVQVLGNYFVQTAEKRQDPYLLAHATTNMVLFGGRLILAHNQMLFPSHKSFMSEVERASEKPAEFLELSQRLLAEPCKVNAKLFCKCIKEHYGTGISWPQQVSRYIEENEWNWLSGYPPLADS